MGLFDFIKNLFKRKKKVSIGLYGHPNSGKTTLANQIAKDWMGKDIGSASNIPHETRTVLKQEKVVIKDGENELDFDIIDTPGIATKIDYQNFLEFGLEEDFVDILFQELCKRNLQHLASQLSTHPQE